jgi:hypothetical protein
VSARIDEVLLAAVEADTVPGVVALAADEDSVIYEGAAGLRSADAEELITPDTMLRIASMTKSSPRPPPSSSPSRAASTSTQRSSSTALSSPN